MGRILLILGIFLVLIGGLWLLQGTNVLGGSVMSGQSFWAKVGGIVIVVGLVLGALGVQMGPARRGR